MTLAYYAEDERDVRCAVASYLRDHGLDVVAFPAAEPLLAQFAITPCDLVLLDIMLPGADGIEAAAALRRTSAVPIIMLTAKNAVDDFTTGFSAGADDYLAKPFELPILLAKIQALLRRIELDGAAGKSLSEVILRRGNVALDPQSREATVDGRPLKLTSLELELLRYLMEHSGQALSRADILRQVWGIGEDLATRAADETNRRVRKKLLVAGATIRIETVWGYGFKLVEEDGTS